MTNDTRRAAELLLLGLGVTPSDKHRRVAEHALRQAQAAGLRWTKEKPTEPGWYWYKRVDTPGICLLRQIDIDRYVDMATEWAGPIAQPIEARAEEVQ